MSDTARLWGWLCATVGEHPPPHRPPFPRPVRVNKREGIESQPGPPSPPSSRPPTHFYRGLVEYLSPSLHTKTGTFHFLFPGEYRPTVVRIPSPFASKGLPSPSDGLNPPETQIKPLPPRSIPEATLPSVLVASGAQASSCG